MPAQQGEGIFDAIATCRAERSLDRQVEILSRLNSSVPEQVRIRLPSLFTNDFVNRALDTLEERIKALIVR